LPLSCAREYFADNAPSSGLNDTLHSRLLRNLSATIAILVLGIFHFGMLFSSSITQYPPNQIDLSNILSPPSHAHPMGTDYLGRDQLSRILDGAEISLSIGPLVICGGLVVGLTVGAISGYFGGNLDDLLMRFVDIILSLPSFPLLLMLSVYVGSSFIMIIAYLIAFTWQQFARIIRAQFLTLKEREFVLAARAVGVSDLGIILRHLLPNALGPIIVAATFGIADAIVLESLLSFLGFGIQPPQASWGNMLSNGQRYLREAPWLVWFPGLSITLVVFGYNYLGDALRDFLDPRFRGR
jgi:peptide/nickel transport system permease protein